MKRTGGKDHVCLGTIRCPHCKAMLCEKCLAKEGEDKCYKCSKKINLATLKKKKNYFKIGLRRASVCDATFKEKGESLRSMKSFESNETPIQKEDSIGSDASYNLEYNATLKVKKRMSNVPSIVLSDGKSTMSKIAKLEELEKQYVPHPSSDLFDLPTTEEFISFTKESGCDAKIVQYATLEKCLQFITSKECEDTYFLQCFVYSYKLITTTTNLLKLLIVLFYPTKPADLFWNDFVQQILFPSRAKILALVKLLVQIFPDDFKNEQNQDQINELIQMYKAFNKGFGDNLQHCLDKAMKEKPLSLSKTKEIPLLPADDKFKGIFCISPLDFAEQITSLQMEAFIEIPADEFLNQGWTKKNKEELTPHIIGMIKISNKLIHIVQTSVVSQPTYALRSLAIFYFVTVADVLRKLQNYDGMKAVVTALQSVSVFRLKASWQMLPEKKMSLFNELAHICSEDNNFAELRKVMKIATPPTIPFIGSTLTDLIYTTDGNKSSKHDKYNFYKLRGIGNLIKEIQMKQKTSFDIAIASNVKEFIRAFQVIEDEDQLFDLSQKNEPKVAEKEIDLTKKPFRHESKEAKDLLKSYLKKIKIIRSC